MNFEECTCNTGNTTIEICLSGFCFDSNVTNESMCTFNSSTDQYYKSWNSQLGKCIIEAPTSVPCLEIGGTVSASKKWVSFEQYTVNNQKDCESLDVCIVNSQVQVGGCNESVNCVGRCPQCVSFPTNPVGVCYNVSIKDVRTCVNMTGFWNPYDNICSNIPSLPTFLHRSSHIFFQL